MTRKPSILQENLVAPSFGLQAGDCQPVYTRHNTALEAQELGRRLVEPQTWPWRRKTSECRLTS